MHGISPIKSTGPIRVAATTTASPRHAAAELRSNLPDIEIDHLVIFFSAEFDAQDVCTAITKEFPGISFSGCSTAGEISPLGMTQGGIIALAFPRANFRVLAGSIENVQETGVESANETARHLLSKLKSHKDHKTFENSFALLFVDGLSNYEEMIVAAINWEIGDTQLIGGSAGDNLNFNQTALLHDGSVKRSGVVLLLIETDIPFHAFKSQNFKPTTTKLVVTKADCEKRIVYELNAEPAALEYAEAIGLLPDDLGPFSFASYPLVVKVGGDYFCRSIRNMNPDGSLSFFCAIDEGLVFTVATPVDLVESTEQALKESDEAVGGLDIIIGFDCILRRLDAENRQNRRHIEELYKRYSVVGFETYGEQFNAMHLNQTLTGIALGSAPATSASNSES